MVLTRFKSKILLDLKNVFEPQGSRGGLDQPISGVSQEIISQLNFFPLKIPAMQSLKVKLKCDQGV